MLLPPWADALQRTQPPADASAALRAALGSLADAVSWQDVQALLQLQQAADPAGDKCKANRTNAAAACEPRDEVAAFVPGGGGRSETNAELRIAAYPGKQGAKAHGTHGQAKAAEAPSAQVVASNEAAGGGTDAVEAQLQHLQSAYEAAAQADLGNLNLVVASALSGACSSLPAQTVATCANLVESYAGAAPRLLQAGSAPMKQTCTTVHTATS